ncbi:hypothetical protein [Streptomyces albireticuli]|uniref:hypothetical protein n=1 Tax=Streptomyces albireticuli TaxID=1940 RepID=UPI0013317AA0|nr:hypothetical protein [Streptomyces albireticuli]
MRLRFRPPLPKWHESIKSHFPECDQIVYRLLSAEQRRARFYGNASVFWFRLIGGIEVILGVLLPLLFIYQETRDNTPLLATVSVSISASAALMAFFGWRQTWGTYKAQSILLTSVIGKWELTLIEIIHSDVADKNKQALTATREAVESLCSSLSQQHEFYFSSIQSPDSIINVINKRNENRGHSAPEAGTPHADRK